jgi:hypothetical protein
VAAEKLSATKTQVLCLRLFAIPVQRNDLTVLTRSFDRRPATLIWTSPFCGNLLGLE